MASFYKTLSKTSRTRYVPYPNRFFSLSDYYMPSDIRQLFHWCVYFYYKNPIIGATINSMAAYPVTDFTYSIDGESQELKDKWKSLLEGKLQLKLKAIEIGLDSFVFGNGIVTVYYPFIRYLKCNSCERKIDITNTDRYDKLWKGIIQKGKYTFNLKCPRCHAQGVADCIDIDSNIVENMNIVRLNPRDIDIDYYEITGERRYYYNIPMSTRTKIRNGKDKYLAKTLPKVYLDAIAANKAVELNRENVFHLSGRSVAGADQAWGKPLIIHSLQKLFYVYTLLRAQEAIATQKIVPFDIIHPISNGETSVIDYTNLSQWQERIKDEVEMWRRDPNYISVMPVPTGFQRMGGDGRMMLLTPEIEQQNKEIVAGMGAPLEFIYGGLTWTGSSISLRMLENKILTHRDGIYRFAQFIADAVQRVTHLPKCIIGMTELRMADDMNRMNLYSQLNGANKLSDEDFLAHLGLSSQEQYKKIEREMKVRDRLSSLSMLGTATAQGEAMLLNAEYSAKAQIAGQKINNLAMNDLDNSLPVIQRETKRMNDILNMKMLSIQLSQAILQEQQLLSGGPPPEEGGGPPPEEEGGGPPPEEEGPPEGSAPTSAEQEFSNMPTEQPAAQQQQYENPFYQGPKGIDVESIVKRWATKIYYMAPEERAQTMAYMIKNQPRIAQKINTYMNLIPPGGTASDADNAFRMSKKV